MDNPKELQALINSVGAMADLTAVYRAGLLDLRRMEVNQIERN